MVGLLKRDIQTSQGSWIMVVSLSLACLCKFQIVKLLLQLCLRIMEVSKGEDMWQVGP
jgi:hypothetical protein